MSINTKFFLNKKNFWIFTGISFLFICVNFLTFDHLLPWNDEVELTETVLNYIDFGQWISKAYPEYGGCAPFSMYVPLPQFLQTVWMFVFGTSMYSARSFNLLIVFLLGIVLISTISKIQDKPLSSFGTIVFAVLLWGCGEFASIYRNGRGDVVGALVCTLLFLYAYEYISFKRKKDLCISALLASVLTWCALQACVLIVFVWIFFYFIFKEDRKYFRVLGKYIMLGFIIGFVAVIGYFSLNHHFMAFIHTILGLSSSLKMLAVKALPFVGPMVGLDPSEWAAKVADDPMTNNPNLLVRIWSVTDFISFDILFLVSVFFVFSFGKCRKTIFVQSVALVMIALSMYIPFVMNVSGRYTHYYWWMSFIPILCCFVYIIEGLKNAYHKVAVAVITMLVMLGGIKTMIDYDSKVKYEEWKSLASRLPIRKKDIISVPDFTLYEIRRKSENCYFTKHYELKNMDLSKLDYYFEYGPDIKSERNSKKSRDFDKAVKNCKFIRLVPIEESKILDLTVYKVEHIK